MMRFRKFVHLWESMDWGYFGELTSYLGNGEAERLNYGTAEAMGSAPFLYVPIKRDGSEIGGIISAARRALSKRGLECTKDDSAIGGYRCFPSEKPGGRTDLQSTGESHVTVAYHTELKPLADARGVDVKQLLEQAGQAEGTPLFGPDGLGMEMPVTVSKPAKVMYGVAKLFNDKPIVALLKVDCPMALEARRILGLPMPKSGYSYHVTIGYAFPKWQGDQAASTDPKFDGSQTPSATQRHNRAYLQQNPAASGLPEWFEFLGYLQLN